MSNHAPVSRAEFEALLARVRALEQAKKIGDANPAANETPLKNWIMEECSLTGLQYGGIRSRIERGHYPHLVVRRVNSQLVFVSGGHRPAVFGKKVGRKAYNFAGVDWSLSDRVIAALVGCERSTVTRWRKHYQKFTGTMRRAA